MGHERFGAAEVKGADGLTEVAAGAQKNSSRMAILPARRRSMMAHEMADLIEDAGVKSLDSSCDPLE